MIETVIYIVGFKMNYFDVDTPAVLIDLAVTSRNIHNYQKYCDENGLNLRPHIKTHKSQTLRNYN